MRNLALLVACFGFTAQIIGQNETKFLLPTPFPSDRAEQSYIIYSELLQSGPIEWRKLKERKQWLIEDTTAAMPVSTPCQPNFRNGIMNPHNAVKAPADRETEWKEVLADYDQHCHDVIQLEREKFSAQLPVRLLNAEEKAAFRSNPRNPPAEFADGFGLHQFTEVFFNPNHTLALVQEGMWCGGLCGNWSWVVLERRGAHWERLPWVSSATFS